jgi:hypothetical protein
MLHELFYHLLLVLELVRCFVEVRFKKLDLLSQGFCDAMHVWCPRVFLPTGIFL